MVLVVRTVVSSAFRMFMIAMTGELSVQNVDKLGQIRQ